MSDAPRDIDFSDAGAVLVDAHVHIHDCFEIGEFLDAAAQNFSAAAERFGLAANFASMLCLTETARADRFGELRRRAENGAGEAEIGTSGWRVSTDVEAESVTVSHPELGRMHIVAGRQIVADERLEVLALGYAQRRADGGTVLAIIDEVTAHGALAVLPWGFGKWLGGRGRVVRSVIEHIQGGRLHIGDNSGRPAGFGEPAEFALGERLGMRILPGTDPLPFVSESDRAGSFGFMCPIRVRAATPWADLRTALVDTDVSLRRFGRLESPFRFVRNQIAMQYQVRMRRGTN